jgi:hypothetical protein
MSNGSFISNNPTKNPSRSAPEMGSGVILTF